MNIIKIAKDLYQNTTGFKSRCVAYSYILFSFIVVIVLVATIGLVCFGIVTNNHTVYIDALKEVFIPIVQISATFFGVAVGFTFGASAMEKPKDNNTTIVNNNITENK